jgi:predicted GIY-YIG superfamily endonuclease
MTGGGWVYIMANRPNGILYVGVTGDIARRAWKTRLIVAGNPGWQDLYEQIMLLPR